ncbi:class I SAM-dependent methyltransferase [Allomesorhizobium alhagi]|jgi:16S rRNA (guanine1207-N2)-methyltransferase|uniref:Methyltransferase small n=1 Tax=Mesorhizobium alhagi CCNWXJ12-2 TaxID=1107882 RepID=H0HJV5_9HYPH|nr:class I SAM-dependent methyltransferase [Mesorhizobium alhagi]EHK59018.1 methyltransferase small [Mesorhizobium alhagi CCNWXJ12-2]
MTSDALKTLFHPFEAESLAAPGRNQRVLFFGAEPGFRLPEGFAADLSLIQGFRPWFRALAGRYKVTPQPEEENFDSALVLCGRHRGENELRIAEALERIRTGGLILVGGGKDDGIASLRKRVEGLVELEGHTPKHHGVAFWFRRPGDVSQAVAALRAGNGETLIEGRFVAAPGMFSSDRIDAGSKLLAAHLPDKISGAVADFCAGWGFLAAELAGRYPKISALDLYEADFASLEAAKRNVAATGALELRFFWHDLLAEEVPHRYDFIVMNPPFHQKREAEPDIGQRMIRTAGAALKPGGRLMMVANRQLPYEKTLAEVFSSYSEVARDGMFKVFAAKR